AEKAAQPEGAARKPANANAKPRSAESADTASKADANAAAGAPASSEAPAAKPQTRTAPVISIESDGDAESWAEYGGWERRGMRRAGPNMAAGIGRITRFSTVLQSIMTNSSILGSC